MRITIVHSGYDSRVPSGENFAVKEQALALSRAGNEVTVVSSSVDESSRERPSSLVRTALRVASARGRNPLAEVEASRPDLIHIHNLFPTWSEQWVQRLDVPVVLTMHNFRPLCANGVLYRNERFCRACLDEGSLSSLAGGCYRDSRIATLPLALANLRGADRPLFSRADKIVVLSKRSEEIFLSYGLSPKKVDLVPNFSREIGVPLPRKGDRQGWVFAGRLSVEKGVLDLIKNWPIGEILDIYGSGPLEQFIIDLGIPDIRFRGMLPPEEVGAAMAAYEGHIFPSRLVENSPMSYLQALAAGTATISRADNAVADEITRSQTGFVIEEFQDISSSLESLRGAPKMAQRCVQEHKKNFSEAVWVERIMAVYDSVS